MRHGIWDFGRDPMDGVTLPRIEEGSSGKPDLDLIPSDDQVLRLIEVLTADRDVLGTMSTVAAFTGVRLGELNALSAPDFDFEAARIRVRLSCVESDAGDFRFKVPGKRNPAVRQVVLEGMVADTVRAHIADLGEVPRGPNIVAGARVPPQRLFFTREGNPFRRSHLRVLFDRATAEVPGLAGGCDLALFAPLRGDPVDSPSGGYCDGVEDVGSPSSFDDVGLVRGRRRGLTRSCRCHPGLRTRRRAGTWWRDRPNPVPSRPE